VLKPAQPDNVQSAITKTSEENIFEQIPPPATRIGRDERKLLPRGELLILPSIKRSSSVQKDT